MQSLKRIQNELAKCTFNIELVDDSNYTTLKVTMEGRYASK